MFIYKMENALIDMLDEHNDLLDMVDRVFETDRDKIGFRSELLGMDIEDAEEIRWLQSGTVIAVGAENFSQHERELYALNPHVRCLTLEEAYEEEKNGDKAEGVYSKRHKSNTLDDVLIAEQEKTYLGLYDITCMNMRTLGFDMAVGRRAYLSEVKAETAGKMYALSVLEYNHMTSRDLGETMYLRLLRRVPNFNELERAIGEMDRGRKGKSVFLKKLLADTSRQRG